MHQLNEGERQTTQEVALYNRYASIIFAYIYRQLPCQQDAEDIMLEVFLAALKNHHLYEVNAEQQLAWLQRVARNKVIDRYRRNAYMTTLPIEYALEIVDTNLMPEQQAIQREAYERLYRSLKQLSPLQQQVVRLRFGQGLRFAEIAAILDKSEGTVRNLLMRTLRRLRTIYEQ